MADSKIIVALDVPDQESAFKLAKKLDPKLCRVKVGKELFVAGSAKIIDGLHELGFAVFLDLKFHDIPNTVAGACRAVAKLGVWMLNVHASGGRDMLLAARDAVEIGTTKLIAVTVLTSLTESALHEVGVPGSVNDQVSRLARVTRECGLDGVVCSAREAAMLRMAFARPFLLVTPGIRLPDAAKDDQSRVVTPQDALRAGADYLVVGRPITAAKDPRAALEEIYAMINQENNT
jgi:orotidine-5'-phosphate decarboxylase